jgi:hypothetical protein
MKDKSNKLIQRPGDLAPLGVRSTIKGNYSFNETFEHMLIESKKSLKQ